MPQHADIAHTGDRAGDRHVLRQPRPGPETGKYEHQLSAVASLGGRH